jgi:long-subunit acyl-CoA synthetase (AMP-forming)
VTSAIECLPELFEQEDGATLLFLPLAHVFGRMIGVAVLLAAVRTGHTDVARVGKDLPTFKPTFVLAVPRVFERIYDSAQRKAAAGGKERIFAKAAETAIAYSRALETGRPGLRPVVHPRPLRPPGLRQDQGGLRRAAGVGGVRWSRPRARASATSSAGSGSRCSRATG